MINFASRNNQVTMTHDLKLIVLRRVKYSDKTSILLTYSRELGPVSFAVNAGAGREATRLRALLMPMSMVECVAITKPGKELAVMKGVQPYISTASIHSNPVKLSVAMMTAELLTAALRGVPADPNLFDYLAGGIHALELLAAKRVANFHLIFIYGLGRMLGIEPDTATYRRGRWLDMRDGVWRDTPAPHSDMLPPEESRVAAFLGKLDFSTMGHLRINRDIRNMILDRMLRYVSIHHTPLAEGLKSPEMLHGLFSP